MPQKKPSMGTFLWRLSVTDVETLSTTFEDNQTFDPVTVFEGEAILTSENRVSANGETKEFDQILEFQQPFLYDPSDGNLLMEFVARDGVDVATLADFEGAPPVEMIVSLGGPDAVFAEQEFRGFITEFTLERVDPGDFNADRNLDASDLELLSNEASAGRQSPTYDVNDDGDVDQADVAFWATNIRITWLGDANLDGEFNSFGFHCSFSRRKIRKWLGGFLVRRRLEWRRSFRFRRSDRRVSRRRL